MSEPTTEAGKLLHDDLAGPVPIVPGPTFRRTLSESIIAIEQEARALPSHPDDGHDHHFSCVRCGVDDPALERKS